MDHIATAPNSVHKVLDVKLARTLHSQNESELQITGQAWKEDRGGGRKLAVETGAPTLTLKSRVQKKKKMSPESAASYA